MSQHNPAARYCVMFDRAIPIDDTVDCAACQENYDLAAIDPDFADEYRDYPRPEARSGNDGIPQPAERPRNPNNLT